MSAKIAIVIWHRYPHEKPDEGRELLTLHADGAYRISIYEIRGLWRKSYGFTNFCNRAIVNRDVTYWAYASEAYDMREEVENER